MHAVCIHTFAKWPHNPSDNMKTHGCHLYVLMSIIALSACQQTPESGSAGTAEALLEDLWYPQTPEEVVAVFCENFFVSAPPKSDNEAAKTAYMLLSSATRNNLSDVRAGLSGRLTMFAGVHEVPGYGFHITGVLSKTEEQALVETCWHYASDDEDSTAMVKVFALAMQEGHWRIDEIQRK